MQKRKSIEVVIFRSVYVNQGVGGTTGSGSSRQANQIRKWLGGVDLNTDALNEIKFKWIASDR
jgi:hypothetical protein